MLAEILAKAQKDFRVFRVETVDTYVYDMFDKHLSWYTGCDCPQEIDEDVATALLLRVPLTIYVQERTQINEYDVVIGGRIVETLRYLLKNRSTKENEYALYRHIMNTQIRVVRLDPNMLLSDIQRAESMINSILSV